MTGQVWEWITGAIVRIVAAFKGAVSGFIGKALGTMGLSVVSFQSILPNVKNFVTSHISAIPPDAMNLLGALGIGQSMSMIVSAFTVRMAWRVWIVPKNIADGLGGGTP